MFPWPLYQQIDRMWQHRQDTLQALSHGFGATREIDNQGMPTDPGHPARKHTEGSMLQAGGAHSLSDTWSLALNNGSGCLWRHVSWCQPCPARRQNEIEVFVIAPLAQHRLNLVTLI